MTARARPYSILARLAPLCAGGWLLLGTCWASPTGILHDPPSARMGDTVPLSVQVQGVASYDVTVTCWYRPQGAGDYRSARFVAGQGDLFTTTLPGEATSSLALKYFIVVEGAGGSFRSRLGSRENPLSLHLLPPAEPVEPNELASIAVVGVIFTVVGLIAVAMRVQWRRKRLTVLDQLFWSKTLEPLIRHPGRGLSRHIGRLSGVSLQHPVQGRRQFSRQEILSKLKEVRSLDPKRLKEETSNYLGSGYKLQLLPVSEAFAIDELKKRVEHLSHEVAILSTAAWVLSASHESYAADRANFLEPFEHARNIVQRAQDAVRHHYDAVAEGLCEKLLARWGELIEPVVDIDAHCSQEALARYLGDSKALTTEMITRLFEFYTKMAERNDMSRRKFLVVALVLAGNEGANINDPLSIRQVFERRGLLQHSHKLAVSSTIIRHAAAIRTRLSAPSLEMSKLQSVHTDIEHVERDLGKSLYTVAGLSEVVSLLLAFDAAKGKIEQQEARNLDILVDDLEIELIADEEEFVEPAPVVHSVEEDDVAAIEMLRTSAVELERAVAEDTLVSMGFFMEHFESKAVRMFAARQELGRLDRQLQTAMAAGTTDEANTTQLRRRELREIVSEGEQLYGQQWINLLTRCVVCRRTMDWQARKQSCGAGGTPIDESVATTIVRRAAQLESDLQDRIQKDRIHNLGPRAELGERFLHRFSRSRVGFALISDMSAVEVSLVA